MTPESTTALALVKTNPLLELQTDSKQSNAAIRRCCAAWQRSYNANIAGKEEDGIMRAFAIHAAAPAYCKAMPHLTGRENIRDFIACVAHGILINAIPEKRANHLLYAAQVALSCLNRESKPQKSAHPHTPFHVEARFFAWNDQSPLAALLQGLR